MENKARNTIIVLGPPPPRLLARLRAGAGDDEVVVGSAVEELAEALPRATVVLAWGADRGLLSQVLKGSPQLRWLHIMSAGINHLLSRELLDTPVPVTNARGVFSPSLGEWVLGAILYFAKDFRRLIRSQGERRWDPFDVTLISGQTVGIVGYGDIGRAVACRARAMGMRVLGLTRRGPQPGHSDEYAERIYAPGDIVSMIQQSDYVVVTAPLTPQTRGLVGEAELAAMKPDAVLINVGRGPVVDEAALIRTLTEKRIKGAALDVFHREPLPPDDPLYSLENVLLSPHCADHTPDWLDNAMEFFLENLERFRAGEPLQNVLEKGLGY
jgi:phosphoglycerate dehydrogenase-like enzyme